MRFAAFAVVYLVVSVSAGLLDGTVPFSGIADLEPEVRANLQAIRDATLNPNEPNPIPPIPAYPCQKLPAPPAANNVTSLRPGNIKVIMAMGDSITAGFAMVGTSLDTFMEYRQNVFDIGEVSPQTFVQYFKKLGASLQGGALTATLPLAKGAYLDAAISGKQLQDWPDQVNYLINTANGATYRGKINWAQDWKLLTIFLGANNLCNVCTGRPDSQPDKFEENLRLMLNNIEQRIPRVFVNLVAIFNISGVWDVHNTDLYCISLWTLMKKECGCLQSGKKEDRQIIDNAAVAYNQRMHKVAAEFYNKRNPQFTVVVQPGLSGAYISDYGRSFLSNLDCFHPSLSANEAFAYQLHNNMFQAIGKKTVVPDIKAPKWICPTADSVIT